MFLEKAFGSSVEFNTVQTAIQACLELLGTREDSVPVLLPVTAPPTTISAVLRSGAQPFLLDIDADTLQIAPDQLTEILDVLGEDQGIVLLTRPFGGPVDPRLLEIVEEMPTILDSRVPPHHKFDKHDLCSATFTVFDLEDTGVAGALVFAHPENLGSLKSVRSGILGLDGALCHLASRYCLSQIQAREDDANRKDLATKLQSDLKKLGLKVYPVSKWYNQVVFDVPKAPSVVAQLSMEKIPAVLGAYPLYLVPEIRSRYTEEPSYPVAASKADKVVCVTMDEENLTLADIDRVISILEGLK